MASPIVWLTTALLNRKPSVARATPSIHVAAASHRVKIGLIEDDLDSGRITALCVGGQPDGAPLRDRSLTPSRRRQFGRFERGLRAASSL